MMAVSFQTAIQWNCRSVVPKKSDVIYLINKHNTSLLALSETWLKPGSIFKIHGFSCLRDDRSDGYGGVALLIRNTISFIPISLPKYNEFSVVAAQIGNICVVSIYMTSPSSLTFTCLNNLLSLIPKPVLLLGDFNSHHISWGCSVSNQCGNLLLELLDDNNLCILNSGSPTRRTSPNENISAVDLSICSPNLASSITWQTLSSTFGSDHFPIIISFPCNSSRRSLPQPRLKYNIKNDTLWNKFKSIVDQELVNQPDISHGIEICTNAFTSALIRAADATFPSKKLSTNFIPSLPWWDKECTEVVNERKKIEQLYNNDMTNENFELLSEKLTDTRKFLKEKNLSVGENIVFQYALM